MRYVYPEASTKRDKKAPSPEEYENHDIDLSIFAETQPVQTEEERQKLREDQYKFFSEGEAFEV